MSESNSTVTYSLTVLTNQGRRAIAFSEEQFTSVEVARQRLLFGLAFEQRIDLALENFAEIETCLLDMALGNALFRGESDSRLRRGRHVVNRFLANFMSSAKLYVDQTSHALSDLYGTESDERLHFISTTRAEYGSSFGYRVFEALRNYSQHRGLPTHSLTFSSSHTEQEEGQEKTKNTVSFGLSPKYLREDGKFKVAVLDELEEAQDKNGIVELMPLAREYISGLARIHKACQDKILACVEHADQVFLEFIELAHETTGEDPLLLRAEKNSPGGRQITESINKKLVDERKWYEQKNQYAIYISRQFVMS